MKYSHSMLIVTLLVAGLFFLPHLISRGQTFIAPPGRHVAREPVEWMRLWLPNVICKPLQQNVIGQFGPQKILKPRSDINKKLPQVLLIGDSITEMYYHDVAKDLKGKAYVGYFSSSLAVGDPMLPAQIALILKNYRFNVIQFNNGMHGPGYSEQEYAKYFPQVIQTIRTYCHGAKLIWANTTPTRMQYNFAKFSPWNKRIIARNKIADTFCRRAGIPITNLYSVLLHHPEYYAKHGAGIHENALGQKVEARHVADTILKVLHQ